MIIVYSATNVLIPSKTFQLLRSLLTENFSESENQFKLKITVNGYNYSDCKKFYRRFGINLTENGQLCAYGEVGVGTCTGDGGDCIFNFEFGFMEILVHFS